MSLADNPEGLRLKVIFIGDSGVGKTSLFTRQVDDVFNQQHLATIGVDFKMKTYNVGFIPVKVQFWDTAGQERFRAINRQFYKGTNCVCLCFSLKDRESFKNLPFWLDELNKYPENYRKVFLIGCKSDLETEVPTDEILIFAQRHGLQYLQTSALTTEGISQAFSRIVMVGTQKEIQKTNVVSVQKVKVNEAPVAKKRTCC